MRLAGSVAAEVPVAAWVIDALLVLNGVPESRELAPQVPVQV